jgi:hypothetical protein
MIASLVKLLDRMVVLLSCHPTLVAVHMLSLLLHYTVNNDDNRWCCHTNGGRY